MSVDDPVSLSGTDNNDELIGLPTNDSLNGGDGNDSLSDDQGQNTYLFGLGSGQDQLNHYNDDTPTSNPDRILLGAGITPAQLILSRVHDDLLIQIANSNDWLIGEQGDDSLDGHSGDDTLDGDQGNDRLLGNDGDDLLLFGDINAEQLWFLKNGNDLEVQVIGTSDLVRIQDWYLGAGHRVEQFGSGDGKVLLDTQVDALVSAMAAFSPPAAGETTLSAAYQTSLNPVIAANWQ